MAWETQGARSVRNDIKIKEDFNFKQSMNILITSQLRTALILNRNIKATIIKSILIKKFIFMELLLHLTKKLCDK